MSIFFTQSGGGNETLQQVLNNGSTLTQNNTISIPFNNTLTITADKLSAPVVNSVFDITWSGITHTIITPTTTTQFASNTNGYTIYGFAGSWINYNATNGNIYLGNENLATDDISLEIIPANKTFEVTGYFNNNKYSIIAGEVNIGINTYLLYIGDYLINGNGTHIFMDVTNQLITTKSNSIDAGYQLDFANDIYIFGNYTNNNSKITLDASSGNGNIEIWCLKNLNFTYDDKLYLQQNPSSSNPITQNSHSATPSPTYLKVNVDGVDYVIELLNP